MAGLPAAFGQQDAVAADSARPRPNSSSGRCAPFWSSIAWPAMAPRNRKPGCDSTRATRSCKGSDSGPVVDLQNPGRSRLLMAIGYKDPDLQMPPAPAEKLPDAAIAALGQWIAAGAHWPDEAGARRGAIDSGETPLGLSSRSGRLQFLRLKMPTGRNRPSTGSSSRSWKSRGCRRRRRPIAPRSFDGRRST